MKRLLVTTGFLLLAAALPNVAAADGDGSIEIRSADAEMLEGVHTASARIQYQLSDRIEEALANGIELEFDLEFDISRVRRLWFDGGVATVHVVHRLRFDTVSERYILHNINTGQMTSFATIFGVLNSLGRVDDLPLIDDSLLSSDGRYRVGMRAAVSISDYPVSLRYLLFWRDDWRVASERYTWLIAR